jgi:hypothetical protein
MSMPGFIPPHSAAPAPSAAAAAALPAPPRGHASTITVNGERVTPRVVSTFPMQNAQVAPGLLVLRVSYSTHMRADGWSYARDAGVDYPDCAKAPRLLDDKESFVLICRTLPGKRYAVWFNRPPLSDFASLSRLPADPYELRFVTTEDEPVRTLADAMKADPALSSASNPVEGDGLATYGQDSPG